MGKQRVDVRKRWKKWKDEESSGASAQSFLGVLVQGQISKQFVSRQRLQKCLLAVRSHEKVCCCSIIPNTGD